MDSHMLGHVNRVFGLEVHKIQILCVRTELVTMHYLVWS